MLLREIMWVNMYSNLRPALFTDLLDVCRCDGVNPICSED